MADYFIQVLFRIPVLFLLDFSTSFIPTYLNYVNFCLWFSSGVIQLICIVASLCVLASSNDQLLTIYYILHFLMVLIGTQLINIKVTPGLLEHDVNLHDIVTSVSAGVMVSWIIYAFSIILYAHAFKSLKPVFMAVCLFPTLRRCIVGSYDNPTFIEIVTFGVVVFISFRTVLYLLFQLKVLVKKQCSVFVAGFRIYGSMIFYILYWRRLRLNSILPVYWVVMMIYQTMIFMIFVKEKEKFHFSFIIVCTAYTCNSFIKVVSLCYVMLHVMKMISKAVHELVKDNHTFVDVRYQQLTGLRESLGFFSLTLFTSFTSLDSPQRIIEFEIIFLLLLSAMIRSVFEEVEPYVMTLNVAGVHRQLRHIQLVLFCVTLMMLTIYIGFYLYMLQEKISFTLLNIITVAHIFSALVLYVLYQYDAHHGELLLEELNDCVYYIKRSCRSFEYGLVVLSLGYRLFDTPKWTGFQIVIMIIVHLYINYLCLRDGWRSLKSRRFLNHKLNCRLNVLPEASIERLITAQDVCPICLDKLETALVTPCNHLFHRFCLRKWLKVQNKCPMCHSVILDAN